MNRRFLADANELCRFGVGELSAGFSSGKFTPLEVAQATLARAGQVQERFNAFSLIEADAALAIAKESTARWRSGAPSSRIDGVPTTIKDIVWVKDWAVRYGSRTTSATACTRDAPSVKRLRAAGAVLIGLTTTPEFGWKAITDSPLTGVTRNPWNPKMTPGGSSGGAVVAAATGAGVLFVRSGPSLEIRGRKLMNCDGYGRFGSKADIKRCPLYPRKRTSFSTIVMSALCQKQTSGCLFDHLVGAREQRWRHGEAERLGGGQVDDEIEFGRLLNRKIGRVGTFENLVNVAGGSASQVNHICPVGHERARCHKFSKTLKRWQQLPNCKVGYALPMINGERVLDRHQCIRVLPSHSLECTIEIIRLSRLQGLNLNPQYGPRGLHLFEDECGIGIGRIPEYRHTCEPGKKLF
jgi:hypothetical protein